MTVAELVEKLATFPQDAEVGWFHEPDAGSYPGYFEYPDTVELDKDHDYIRIRGVEPKYKVVACLK